MLPDSTNADEISFIVGEYRALWQELGLEEFRLETSIAKARPSPEVRKPAVAPTPLTPDRPATLDTLEQVREWLGDCQRCGLCETRTRLVFGAGSAKARLMFVGEGPGADEDIQGLPFVGKSGELLTKIVEAMGLTREQVYITNVVNCRPPNNRVPAPDEIAQCAPFLRAQIETISPTVVVALGATAAAALTGNTSPMSALRGRFHPLAFQSEVPVMPTYHPAYLLRNPAAKKTVWEDMKQVMGKLGPAK